MPVQDSLDLTGEPRDESAELAKTLGVDVEWFVDVLGLGWSVERRPPDLDYDADPTGGKGYPVTPWHISGAPPLLMVRVFPGHLFLAEPRGVWAQGTHGLEYRPCGQINVGVDGGRYGGSTRQRDLIRAAVAGIVARRRDSIRWCRTCRTPHGPETLVDDELGPVGPECHGCFSVRGGVF